ncbi:LPS translocon maturation chaperone LptM [Halopseudomonas sabulinigri]|uniref:Lipoprotein-attachment site-containing protein n=1 Tax=Halopseudomonas sabulinigri TaxID=472181 RepID=A0A1H1SXH3_9GAMM|nr:lipoprotein [Halopseudomonas sabulinigri]SDS52672.1 lipoprotein-attachment site-containing protein [Halopseudomonas sabulinigri]
MKHISALLFGLLVLAGCGQKGPLYLPEDVSGQPPTPAQEELIQEPTEK